MSEFDPNADLTPDSSIHEDELAQLSDEERKILINLMDELSKYGSSNTLKSLWYEDYEEVPVDIDTFIDDPYYLGESLGEGAVFPFWRKVLRKLFAPDSKYFECILTGAIGIGKTTIACIGLAYMLYKLLCLKNPPSYYGLSKMSIMAVSFFNVTLDLAYGVAYAKFQSMLTTSPWFLEHGTIAGTKNPVYIPGKNIQFVVGSSDKHALGKDVFCVTGDTPVATFNGVYRIKDLVGDTLNVYQLDNDRNVVLSNPCHARETKKVTSLLEIEMDNGGILRCTEDHPIMLIDGTYKKAGELTPEDELMEVYYGSNH